MKKPPAPRRPIKVLLNAVLGLDIGPTSIGWALLDEAVGKLFACGVRIFPEGVDRDQQGGELSKNETRRIARGMRRQIARRSRRKARLREALVLAGLFPADKEAQRELEQLDPYELRRKALDQPLTPHEIGRVLMHLNQRRGFLSNRKADKGKKKEASETLAAISALQGQIEDAGHRTLGEHFAQLRQQQPLYRVRGHYTRRDMFEREFDAIWQAQAKHHPQLLNDALKHGEQGATTYPREPVFAGNVGDQLRRFGLHGLIFFQRPMYWPKSVVGQCELEPKQKRCPRADRVAQHFRLLQEVNNLLLIAPDGEINPLDAAQRTKLLAFLSKKKEASFDDIRKELKLLEGYGFNLEAGDRRKLLGMPTDCLLAGKKLFGKGWWERAEAERTAIVRVLLDGNEDRMRFLAKHEWGLDDETIEELLEVDFPEGYSSYSQVALDKLLPHMEQGLPLNAREPLPCALRAAGYTHENVKGNLDQLPLPPELTNPIVRQALHEVRKVVNAIIREYGKPGHIHIELAREVKGSAIQRELQSRTMRQRERVREEVARRIQEDLHETPTRSKINTYLLWQEQEGRCIYSGEPIPQSKLFGGKVNVDHILPYSRSLDDSLMNKVVCYRRENDDKGNRTPHEWLAATNPEKYQAVLQRAAKLPIEIRNRKRPRFSQTSCELQEFISRQLVDTAYITRAVVEYVQCLADVDVLGTKGQLTAEVRHRWGLNTVLQQDGLDLKNRGDHRHHAVDATVVALTDRGRLQKLSRARSDDSLPLPWKTFRQDVEAVVNSIHVSHRSHRKVAGALHEETLYGPTKEPSRFVYRKPLSALTASMIEDIRDEAIRKLVIDRLAEFGIQPGEKKKIPAEAWRTKLCMKSGVEVKKVRLIKQDETIRPLRNGTQFVKPGSNHHVCIFEYEDVSGRTKREPVFVSMLEAARRLRDGEAVIQRQHPERPKARFVMSLSRGETVLATFKGLERLVWFRTGASTQGQLYFVDHRDARPDKEAERFVARANSLQARKVTVDPIGRVRWAND